MTPNLLTLTASDLRGCCGGMMCQTIVGDAVFHGVLDDGTLSVWLVKQGRQYTILPSVSCSPSDYIRAWLGMMDVLHTKPQEAYICRGKLILKIGDIFSRDFRCPAALASAMGSSVWRRTDKGWEVVE